MKRNERGLVVYTWAWMCEVFFACDIKRVKWLGKNASPVPL